MTTPYRTISIAIIDPNVLSGLGLQQILTDMMPMVEVSSFLSFDELQASNITHIVHYFVASRIYFEHAQFFRENASRSIVLVNGDLQIQGVPTLNVCQSQKSLVKSIMALYHQGHAPQRTKVPSAIHPGQPITNDSQAQAPLLTPREQEVAIMLAKGLINKEIADRLNISTTTVITHRKNIMEKLHARSMVDIIIYAVMNGLVDVGEL
jgi:Response regulator containing a CheY-like receiver domain and an HTH DNA-binding domain